MSRCAPALEACTVCELISKATPSCFHTLGGDTKHRLHALIHLCHFTLRCRYVTTLCCVATKYGWSCTIPCKDFTRPMRTWSFVWNRWIRTGRGYTERLGTLPLLTLASFISSFAKTLERTCTNHQLRKHLKIAHATVTRKMLEKSH